MRGATTGTRCDVIYASNNAHTHNMFNATGSTVDDSDLTILYANKVVATNNLSGTDAETLQVASNTGFIVGETITGSSSTTTATVTGTDGSTVIYIHETGDGNFTASETLTGSESAASTTLAASSHQYDTEYYLASIYDVGECWRGYSMDYKGKAYYTNNITTDNVVLTSGWDS